MTCGPARRRFALVGAIAGVLITYYSPVVADEATVSPPAAPAEVQASPGWTLRLPPDAPVTYHGMASFDEAGMGTAGMLYPAPGVAGLLAAIITHGVIVDAAKQKQKDQMQAAADQVLEPYKPFLDKFAYRDLMQRAIAKAKLGGGGRLVEADADAGRATLVESVPVFKLTQDRKAIVLDNLVAIQLPGVSTEAAYRTSIRVVSSPSNSADPAASWSANDGERIKDESARLVAESFDVAFDEVARVTTPGSAPYRTIRYLEGAVEKIERAQVLAEQCERLLIRTLRGNLMSVPLARSAMTATAESRCTAEVSSR
jgi:hypothetical protein